MHAINVKYIPGTQLVLADALSRTYLPIDAADKYDVFEIHVLGSVHQSDTMLQKLTDETKRDVELQQFHKVE